MFRSLHRVLLPLALRPPLHRTSRSSLCKNVLYLAPIALPSRQHVVQKEISCSFTGVSVLSRNPKTRRQPVHLRQQPYPLIQKRIHTPILSPVALHLELCLTVSQPK